MADKFLLTDPNNATSLELNLKKCYGKSTYNPHSFRICSIRNARRTSTLIEEHFRPQAQQ